MVCRALNLLDTWCDSATLPVSLVPCLALELGSHAPPSHEPVVIDWDRWQCQEDQVMDIGLIDSVERLKQWVPLNLQLQLMGFEAMNPYRLPNSRLIDASFMTGLNQILSPPRATQFWLSKWDQITAENALLRDPLEHWDSRIEFEDLDNLRDRTATHMAEVQIWVTPILESLAMQKKKFFNFAPVFNAPFQAPDVERLTKWTAAECPVQDPVLFEDSSFCFTREDVKVTKASSYI